MSDEKEHNMKKATNAYQGAYIIAKAHVETIESQQAEIEKKYIADNGIVNADGIVPRRLYCIEDSKVFERAVRECSDIIFAAGFGGEGIKALQFLKDAEDRLISYCISVAPADDVREILQEAVKTDYSSRQRVLDIALCLDVSTVPEGI